MVRRMIGGIALACVVAAPMTACGGDDGPDAKVAWASKVCDGVKKNTQRVQLPTVDPRNAKKSRAAILTFLGDMGNQLQAQANSLSAAGSPPVGSATYQAALANLTKVRMELANVSAGLRKAKITDTRSLTRALSSYQSRMGQFSTYQGPAKELRGDAELGKAFGAAQQCNGVGV